MQKDVGSVSRVPEDPPKQRKAAKQRRSSVFGPMDTMPVLASQVGKLGAENHRMSIMSRAVGPLLGHLAFGWPCQGNIPGTYVLFGTLQNPTRQTPDASRREHQAPSSPKNLRRIPRRHSAGPFGQPFTDLPPNDHGKDGEETSHLPGGGVKQPADASRKNEEQLGQAKRKTISHVSSKATEHTLVCPMLLRLPCPWFRRASLLTGLPDGREQGFSGAEWIRQRRRTAGVLQAPEALASDSEIDTESSDDDGMRYAVCLDPAFGRGLFLRAGSATLPCFEETRLFPQTDFEIFHAMAPSSTLLTEANRVVQSLVDRDTAGGALADTGSHSGIALELSEISAQLTQVSKALVSRDDERRPAWPPSRACFIPTGRGSLDSLIL